MSHALTSPEISEYIQNMPNEVLHRFSMSRGHGSYVPGMEEYYSHRRDEDGFRVHIPDSIKKISKIYKYLQNECWKTFCDNPQVRTAIMDNMGRLAGNGFGAWSEHTEIQDTLDLISEDPRNRLHTFLPKYLARSDIEGELYLVLTLHTDGFIEVDFRDPGTLGGAWTNTGIITLQRKPTMPIVYCFDNGVDMDGNVMPREQIPSIFVARYPELLQQLRKEKPRAFDSNLLGVHHSTTRIFAPFGGYFRFVVAWDKGFMTQRNISHLRTVIKWVNLYESLKLYEIDHKKSSGAYLWAVNFADPQAFSLWMSMTDAEREQTGLLRKKAPGGTLFLPPGMTLEAKNPTLPKITDADTDILAMVGSGLNTTSSQMMGSENSTFASATASKGPMTDRTKDAIGWFENYLRYDLWDSIFFLRSTMGKMPATIKTKMCYAFKDKKPLWRNQPVPVRKLIDFSFPHSELANLETLTKAFFGVKHGSMADSLGIPRAELVKRLGFGNYSKLRQLHAVEDATFPELVSPEDQERQQESAAGKDAGIIK